jgi:tetratricopeptide (TPR) repeat protein
MFASCAILWIIQQVREGKTKVLAIPAIVIVAMIVFSHTDFYGTNTVGRSNMHMSLGNRYFASGSYSQAADAYKEALTDNPQNADAMNALGNTYMVLGKQNEARRLYEKSLKVNVTVDALCKLAIIHVQSGVMDSAELYLSEAVKMDSTNPEVNYYTGMFYAYNKKPRTAISHLETSLQYYPDPQYRKNIHLNLGKLYLEIGNKEKAKKHLLDAGVKQSEVLKILSM